MVTHDSFAASFCDRVIILRDGGVWRTLARGEKDRRTFRTSCWTRCGRWGGERPMTRFLQVTAALRRKSLGQYALLTLCYFVSVLPHHRLRLP